MPAAVTFGTSIFNLEVERLYIVMTKLPSEPGILNVCNSTTKELSLAERRGHLKRRFLRHIEVKKGKNRWRSDSVESLLSESFFYRSLPIFSVAEEEQGNLRSQKIFHTPRGW